jgi:hypothetical protein
MSVETAAQKAGMSVRTMYRRMADPECGAVARRLAADAENKVA